MLTRLLLCFTLTCGPALADGFAAGDIIESPLDLVTPVLQYYEYTGEGRPRTEITVAPNEDGVLVVQIEDTGFLDDSVEGQRYIYTMELASDWGWLILTATTEVRCYRGENRDWQEGPCP